MEEKAQKCVSMGRTVINDKGSVTFNCPGCGNQKITRSFKARQISARYKCEECSFEGPN